MKDEYALFQEWKRTTGRRYAGGIPTRTEAQQAAMEDRAAQRRVQEAQRRVQEAERRLHPEVEDPRPPWLIRWTLPPPLPKLWYGVMENSSGSDSPWWTGFVVMAGPAYLVYLSCLITLITICGIWLVSNYFDITPWLMETAMAVSGVILLVARRKL